MGHAGARVLVVDDNQAYREFLQVTLEDEGYDVSAQADGPSALRAAATFRPDLAILDVVLGDGGDGFAVGRRLRDTGDPAILYLSAVDDSHQKLAGFDAGADDFIVKGTPVAELRARIRAILRRSGRSVATTWQIGELIIDEAAHTVDVAGRRVTVTKVEFDLLNALARHHGRVVPKRTLLSQVWGFDAYDPNVVEVHVSALRKKLATGKPGYIETVRGVGYVLRTPA